MALKKRDNNYIYAGVLPFGVGPGGRVYFLLGREQVTHGWSGSNKWSSFGGSPDGQSPRQAAAREAYEESMGFLGTESEIRSHLYDELKFKTGDGYTYLFPFRYDSRVPEYFRNVFIYFTKCAKIDPKTGRYSLEGCGEGWFEKSEIMWIDAEVLCAIVFDRWKALWGKKPVFRKEFIRGLKESTLFKTFDFRGGLPKHLAEILRSKSKIQKS